MMKKNLFSRPNGHAEMSGGYRIAACALALGLIITPGNVLAAGMEADRVSLDVETEDAYWDEEVKEDFWEIDDSWEYEDDWEIDDSWEYEDDWEIDDSWEYENTWNEDDEDWKCEEYDEWDVDTNWDGTAIDAELPEITCCDAEPCEAPADENEDETEDIEAVEELEEGHTALSENVTTQSLVLPQAEYAEEKDSAVAGIYTPAEKIQLCAAAGAEDKVLVETDENAKIYCYGYYTEVEGIRWFYVQYVQNGKVFTGFCNSEGL